MRTKYLLLVMFLLGCITANSYSQLVFLNRYNGGGGGGNVSTAIATDLAGNTYVTGYTTGIFSGHDITTLKYDPSGHLIWSQTFNGTGNSTDEAYAITLDAANNVYVGGSTTGATSGLDMVLIKYDNNGNQLWVRTYSSSGNNSDEAYAITIDALNNPIISGYAHDAVIGNQTAIVKFDSSGTQQWVQLGGLIGQGTGVVYAITVDAANNIYATGSAKPTGDVQGNKNMITMKFSPNGTQQWTNTFTGTGAGDNESYSIASDGNDVFITGYTSTSNQGKDAVTMKYSGASGSTIWQQVYNNRNGNGDDIPRKLIVDDHGDVILTGSSQHSNQPNSEDYLTIKYSGDRGNQQLARTYNDPNLNFQSIAYGVTQFKFQNIYVTGSSRQGSSAGTEDIVTLQYETKHGNVKAMYRIANPGSDCAYDIKADHDGNFMLAGYLSNNSNGNTPGISSDMCVCKYGPNYFNSGQIISVVDLETGIPKTFNLHQNYPNPFNPTTNIKFDVGQSSIVRIALYDILGREVLVPVNEYMNAGNYEISISMGNLASGLYFYKMTSGSFTDIKKMILTK